MVKREKPVQYGTRNKSSKKRSIKMNSEITPIRLSKSNIEACISESWLKGMITNPEGMEVDEVKLTLPDMVAGEVTFKPKEVAQLN